MSLVTNVTMFIVNFNILMVYFYLSMTGGKLSKMFQVPTALQFINLILYSNRLLVL